MRSDLDFNLLQISALAEKCAYFIQQVMFWDDQVYGLALEQQAKLKLAHGATEVLGTRTICLGGILALKK